MGHAWWCDADICLPAQAPPKHMSASTGDQQLMGIVVLLKLTSDREPGRMRDENVKFPPLVRLMVPAFSRAPVDTRRDQQRHDERHCENDERVLVHEGLQARDALTEHIGAAGPYECP